MKEGFYHTQYKRSCSSLGKYWEDVCRTPKGSRHYRLANLRFTVVCIANDLQRNMMLLEICQDNDLSASLALNQLALSIVEAVKWIEREDKARAEVEAYLDEVDAGDELKEEFIKIRFEETEISERLRYLRNKISGHYDSEYSKHFEEFHSMDKNHVFKEAIKVFEVLLMSVEAYNRLVEWVNDEA